MFAQNRKNVEVTFIYILGLRVNEFNGALLLTNQVFIFISLSDDFALKEGLIKGFEYLIISYFVSLVIVRHLHFKLLEQDVVRETLEEVVALLCLVAIPEFLNDPLHSLFVEDALEEAHVFVEQVDQGVIELFVFLEQN